MKILRGCSILTFILGVVAANGETCEILPELGTFSNFFNNKKRIFDIFQVNLTGSGLFKIGLNFLSLSPISPLFLSLSLSHSLSYSLTLSLSPSF